MHLIRPRSFIKSIVYARTRCSKKWPFLILSSKFLGLAQDCLRRSSYFEYKSILFCSVQCSGTHASLALSRQLRNSGCVQYIIEWVCLIRHFCDILLCMLGICCHGEVMWQRQALIYWPSLYLGELAQARTSLACATAHLTDHTCRYEGSRLEER